MRILAIVFGASLGPIAAFGGIITSFSGLEAGTYSSAVLPSHAPAPITLTQSCSEGGALDSFSILNGERCPLQDALLTTTQLNSTLPTNPLLSDLSTPSLLGLCTTGATEPLFSSSGYGPIGSYALPFPETPPDERCAAKAGGRPELFNDAHITEGAPPGVPEYRGQNRIWAQGGKSDSEFKLEKIYLRGSDKKRLPVWSLQRKVSGPGFFDPDGPYRAVQVAILVDKDGDGLPDHALLDGGAKLKEMSRKVANEWTGLDQTSPLGMIAATLAEENKETGKSEVELVENALEFKGLLQLPLPKEWTEAGGCAAWKDPVQSLLNEAHKKYRWDPRKLTFADDLAASAITQNFFTELSARVYNLPKATREGLRDLPDHLLKDWESLKGAPASMWQLAQKAWSAGKDCIAEKLNGHWSGKALALSPPLLMQTCFAEITLDAAPEVYRALASSVDKMLDADPDEFQRQSMGKGFALMIETALTAGLDKALKATKATTVAGKTTKAGARIVVDLADPGLKDFVGVPIKPTGSVREWAQAEMERLRADPNLTDAQRIDYERAMFVAALDEAKGRAVLDAHNVGIGEIGADGVNLAGYGNWTQAQLRRKTEILKDAGFPSDEIRIIYERKLAGNPPAPVRATAVPGAAGSLRGDDLAARTTAFAERARDNFDKADGTLFVGTLEPTKGKGGYTEGFYLGAGSRRTSPTVPAVSDAVRAQARGVAAELRDPQGPLGKAVTDAVNGKAYRVYKGGDEPTLEFRPPTPEAGNFTSVEIRRFSNYTENGGYIVKVTTKDGRVVETAFNRKEDVAAIKKLMQDAEKSNLPQVQVNTPPPPKPALKPEEAAARTEMAKADRMRTVVDQMHRELSSSKPVRLDSAGKPIPEGATTPAARVAIRMPGGQAKNSVTGKVEKFERGTGMEFERITDKNGKTTGYKVLVVSQEVEAVSAPGVRVPAGMVHREASVIIENAETIKQIEAVLSPENLRTFDQPATTRDFTAFARMRDAIGRELAALPPPPAPAQAPTFAKSPVTDFLGRVAEQIERAAAAP